MNQDEHPVPRDARYVPLQQMPYCCLPTCLLMVILRHGIKPVPVELLGWHLGLTVPPEDRRYFYNPRVSERPPPQGYGTQVGISSLDYNAALASLGVPLQIDIRRIDRLDGPEALGAALAKIQEADLDCLLCVHWGDTLDREFTHPPISEDAGHILVFDRLLDDGRVRVIDPSRGPKWRAFEMRTLHDSMCRHGAERAAGLWVLTRVCEK